MLNFELGSYITIWHNLPISRLFPLKDHSTLLICMHTLHMPIAQQNMCQVVVVCVLSLFPELQVVNMQIVSALALE